MKLMCIFLIATFFCRRISAEELSPSCAVQIVSQTDQLFNIKFDELKSVLENDSIKDRNVVVVSIAGAFRQGKSFLLNFFVKYLYAQYKTFDVSDRVGAQSNDSFLNGFKFRCGQKRETTGIWIWPEIFTHDFEDGEKVAIILLDTQGFFDDQTSIKACTTIFALSMMLSSVQCYNVMQKVQEDNLQHLELFTEYSRLASEQWNDIPFQKLLFVIRDWPYAFETPYGWQGQTVVNDFLAENNNQTEEMKQLRKRIDSSFEAISAFLLPFPGVAVAHGNNFTGSLQEISTEFLEQVDKLASGIFSPDRLIVKKINGEKMCVRDVIKYLEKYLEIFNGDALPEPKSILMATAEASAQISYTNSLHFYIDAMHKSINEKDSYFTQGELVEIHQKTKEEAIAQFQAKRKLADEQFRTTFQPKIEGEIEEKFLAFNETNEAKYEAFMEKAKLNNAKVLSEISDEFERKLVWEFENSTGLLRKSDLNTLFVSSKQAALQEFDSKKMDDGETDGLRESLAGDMDLLQLELIKISEIYQDSLKYYSDAMKRAIDTAEPFVNQSNLVKLHRNTKKEAQSEFSQNVNLLDSRLSAVFQRKFDNEIEEMYPTFEQFNEGKLNEFITRANEHNEIVSNELKAKFEKQVRNGIGRIYLSDNMFITLFMDSKVAALEEFGTRKMGDDDITAAIREKLELELDSLQAKLKQANEENRPPGSADKKKGMDKFTETLLNFAANVIGAAIGTALLKP